MFVNRSSLNRSRQLNSPHPPRRSPFCLVMFLLTDIYVSNEALLLNRHINCFQISSVMFQLRVSFPVGFTYHSMSAGPTAVFQTFTK